MDHDTRRQEKPRSRRGGHLSRGLRHGARWLALATTLAVGLVVALAGAVYLAGLSGTGSERLAREAQRAIQQLTDVEVETRLDGARVVFDSFGLVALQVRGVRVTNADTDRPVLDAQSMRFGLSLRALLGGDLRVVSAKVMHARLAPDALRLTGRGAGWSAPVTDEKGLVDPSLVSTALYGAMHRAFGFIEASGTRRVTLSDISFAARAGSGWGRLDISSFVLERSRSHGIAFAGEALLGGRRILLEGRASTDGDGKIVDSLALTLRMPQAEKANEGGTSRLDGLIRSFGSLRVSITGGETPKGAGKGLSLALSANGMEMGLEPTERIAFDGTVRASITDNSRTVTIRNASVSTGRSVFRFHGAFGPVADVGEEGAPAYAFQLFTGDSVVAPGLSPEPALTFAARVAGRYLPRDGRAVADVISVNTGSGTLMASAAMTLEEGKSPGVSLAAAVSGMATGHVKQLWPWFAARGVREWVLGHLFGGRVTDGEIQMRVPPGRLGNGVPLNEEEVNGHFKVHDTRFDVAGQIPPVRDGNGRVRFAGTSIRASLSSGTVYMPSGRKVSASSGTFVLEDAELTPRIGKLEIDVKGAAPAIVELASYEPIGATRYLDLAPNDVSGDVTGHISTDIPLQDSIPRDLLSWHVVLDFKGLSVSKPFDGQKVTDAEGKLIVRPDSADVKAEGRLNGVPARFDIIEPLGRSSVEGQREVVLEMNDAARERLAPGLSAILSGTATVAFEAIGNGRQNVTANLEDAVISLPWAGWRKGSGVPATATFVLDPAKDAVRLEDFALSGDGFGANGEITLAHGALSTARFASVRLNKGDDFSVAVESTGSGYDVSVRGAWLDARSLIRRFAPSRTGTDAGTSPDTDVPIRLDLDVGQVKGFHDEVLEDVQLAYAGTGSDISSLSVDASTGAGGEVTLHDATQDGTRSMHMRSTDAGALLRFLDIYEHMEGGRIGLALAGRTGEPLTGQIDARDFWIVNEPRLGSLVAATPSQEGRADQATPSRVDASRVKFDRGFVAVRKGEGYLMLSDGSLRGPLIGTTFQGTLYDARGNIAMTGTFMPAYGVNRIFGEIPVIGQILGNGRDRGLIGVTYRLTGKASAPKLEVNPISAIAPGIFRQLFEFR